MVSDFDKELNISYVDETLPRPSNRLIIKHCLCSYIIYFVIYIFLKYNDFFNDFFVNDLSSLYLILFLCYIFLAPVIYFIFRPKSLYRSHSIDVCNYIYRTTTKLFSKDTAINKNYQDVFSFFIPTYYEKQALMLTFIKMYFGCIMTGLLYKSIPDIINNLQMFYKTFLCFIENFTTPKVFVNFISDNSIDLYVAAVSSFLILDLLVFSFGYITETAFLNNKIRTVDTNLLGVFFCLISYSPFVSITNAFVGSSCVKTVFTLPDYVPSAIVWAIHLLLLLFVILYALSAVALGTKASNLTNRGIVTKFPFNIVRHPAYSTKNLAWVIFSLTFILVDFSSPDFDLKNYVILVISVILSRIAYLIIYYFRAVTEERHLMQDPEYQEYAKKVRWRFIPYII